jgi:hypothetical protein
MALRRNSAGLSAMAAAPPSHGESLTELSPQMAIHEAQGSARRHIIRCAALAFPLVSVH